MKRVLFEHNVPGPLERFFGAHDVHLADEMGWAKLKNGQLLDSAKAAGFDVLLSSDKTIHHEQNMTGRTIAMIYLSDNHWPAIAEYGAAIVQAVEQAGPGEVRPVNCGTFVPRKFRNPGGPA